MSPSRWLVVLGVVLVAGTIGISAADGMATLRERADAGDATARFRLAVAYANGNGVAKDPAEAVRWFRSAAEQGHDRAQYDLAIAYAKGMGVTKDDAEAMRWFRKAAEQGNARAQLNLAIGYMNGMGVPKNEIEGIAWLNVSALSYEKAVEVHERMEARLERPALVAAHQRCMELLKGLRRPPPAGPPRREANDGGR